MVGYTPPNRYQPRAKWKDTLDGWVARNAPPNAGGWQMDIYHYWLWTTKEGMSLEDAWARLRMDPNNAKTSLERNSIDRGLIPTELFSRVLARSQATTIDPNDDVAGVIIEPEPTPAPGQDDDNTSVGYTPPNHYRPRARWKDTLDGWVVRNAPATAGGWQMDIYHYWLWTTKEGMSLEDAWKRLRMDPNNAKTSLERNALDRGLIPPELFGRVLARSRASTIDPDDEVAEVILHREPTA